MSLLRRREATLDWMSEQVYRVLPLSDELQRIKELFPEQTIMEAARPFYSADMGRGSEDPVLQSKIMKCSFRPMGSNYSLRMCRC